MNATRVGEVLTGVLGQFGLELEAVEIAPSGRRTRVRVVVDGDGPDGRGPGLDDLAEATKAVSATLDASDATGTAPYTLEVSSRGVSRPLTKPQHWRRNRGRLVEVTLDDDSALTGRITASTDTAVSLDADGTAREIPLDKILKAVVQAELGRRPAHEEPAHENKED